jgi:hypothetical protein
MLRYCSDKSGHRLSPFAFAAFKDSPSFGRAISMVSFTQA